MNWTTELRSAGRAACLLLSVNFVAGCSSVDRSQRADVQRSVLPDVPTTPLPDPTYAIGAGSGPGDDLTFPIIVADDPSGAVYVYDVRLVELKRFD